MLSFTNQKSTNSLFFLSNKCQRCGSSFLLIYTKSRDEQTQHHHFIPFDCVPLRISFHTCKSKQMQRITPHLFSNLRFLSINIYSLICRHKQPTFPVIVKQRAEKSIIALWDVSYIVKAHCQPIVVMCIDWSKKPEPLFKAIQHSINTPFALWQSSTAASWLICLLLPCQSIMNHRLCHRTMLHFPAGRNRKGVSGKGNREM